MDTKFAKKAYTYFIFWAICTSLAMTVCTIVDAFCVGNIIGSNGLAVANISTPVFLTYALFGITIGIGANIKIGHLLGASEIKEANRIFHSQLSIGLCLGILCLIPLLFRDAFFAFLGVTEELFPLAEQYLTVVMISAPIFILYHILSITVRTDSDPKLAAIASIAVIIINLSLDLLFMIVMQLGIIGASASLCIAETVGVIILFTHFLKKRALLKLKLVIPTFSEIRGFAANGFGVGSANIFQAIVMFLFNILLLKISDGNGALYVAIYGVIYTISTIPLAVFDGASNALSTVTSFFVGESDADSIITVLKKALRIVIISGITFAVLFMIFSEQLIMFFDINDPSSMDISVTAIRIFSLSIIFTGINTVITAFSQAIDRAKLAGILSVLRNFLLILAIGIVMILNFSIIGLCLTLLLTELISTAAIAAIMLSGKSHSYMQERFRLSGRVFENNYIIEPQSMEQISSDLEHIYEEWDIGPKQAFFMNFICEEILLNIIKFGLNDDNEKKYYIDVKLMEKDNEYVMRIRDNVSAYNPFESNGDEIDNGVLMLINKKTKYCDYQRKMIFNYFYVII